MITRIDIRPLIAVGPLMVFWGVAAFAGQHIDKSYIKSLVSPGKVVLVVEYEDGEQRITDRKGFASAGGFRAASATDITVNETVRLHLFGVEPCAGEMVNRKEDFAGDCAEFAKRELANFLKSPRVLYCRAFVSEENAPIQDATCFGYYYFPGSLDTVDNLEEQLVSLGALRLARYADGSLMRPDLAAAERIGRQGFGMWADPRWRAQ